MTLKEIYKDTITKASNPNCISEYTLMSVLYNEPSKKVAKVRTFYVSLLNFK